jgi:hypothetical protein
MTTHASGSFDVKLTPQAQDEAEGSAIGRMLIDKQFHGDLEATSKGQMLAAGTAIEGSAGYVATVHRAKPAVRLRGGRRGGPPPLHPRPWACAPWNPKMM